MATDLVGSRLVRSRIRAAGARLWSLLPSLQRSSAQRAAILCYHSVSAHYDSRYDPITPALFEAHLEYLREYCHPLSMDEVVDAIRLGTELPPRAVAVTFDDGYRDNFDYAYPLLLKYRIPATIYVVTGYVQGEIELADSPHLSALTWQQMRVMRDSGTILFGAHTRSHRILSGLADDEVVNEVVQSKRALEAALGARIRHFAYPNGRGEDIPRSAIQAVMDSGFDSASSTIWGTRHRAQDLYWLNRIMITASDSVATLSQKIAGDYDYLHWLHRARALLAGRGLAWGDHG